MKEYRIVFSPKAREWLEEIADYLYEQNISAAFVVGHIQYFEDWLERFLCFLPNAGSPMPQFGDDVRHVVYQEYSFLYRVSGCAIEILTVYQSSLP